jgi:dihydrofolate reductase
MTQVALDISVSVDGYVAGPNPTLEQPLGAGGEQLHDWITRLAAWRSRHGLDGGDTGAENDYLEELLAPVSAYVMGRRMFSGGQGPWNDDPNADGWWGDEPPFQAPVFVLTSHARELDERGGTTFTFVTEGIEAALEQAKAAAGGGGVRIAGGASVAQQALRAGELDVMHLHVVPLLLGGGVSLFGGLGREVKLERALVLSSPAVTHMTYTRA